MKKPFLILALLILSVDPIIGQVVRMNADATVRYVLSCRKPNGAFGPQGQEYSDLAWTYPAVYTLNLLKAPVPDPDSCFQNGQQAWIEKAAWKNGPWYWSFFQKTDLYRLFGREGPREPGVSPGKSWQLTFKTRTSYLELRKYPEGEFFDMPSLWHLVGSIRTLKGTVANPEAAKAFVVNRQAQNGGFEEGLDSIPQPADARAHLIITHHAVLTLKALGIPVPRAQACIDWLRSCQTPEGGFRWSPVASSSSNKPDVWYTWAAIQALQALGSGPKDVNACIGWLNSLQNADGGFGDRPGWNSRLYSTYYAVHALEMLTGDARRGILAKSRRKAEPVLIPEGRYAIFQAHHKSPAGGREMVDSVAAMGLTLIGVKSKEKDIDPAEGMSRAVREARAYARQKGYKLEIVECPENYNHRLRWFSGLRADHVSNFIIPPVLSASDRKVYATAYEAGKTGLPWPEFKARVIRPILDLKTLFYPELDYTLVNAYLTYDEGLDGQTGYNAVPGAHFGNSDWMRHFPYKERWEGKLPVIADGDAHGDIYQWRKYLDEFRNVYLAKTHSYDDYIEASLNGRSVCVIRLPSGGVRYYGAAAAVAYLKKHRKEWQWWQDNSGK